MISTSWSIGARCSSANAAWSLTVTMGRSATTSSSRFCKPTVSPTASRISALSEPG